MHAKQTVANDQQEAPAAAFGKTLDRIANLLALIAIKGENQTEKILTLTAAGYSAKEVADLLRTSANTVSVTVYKARQDGKRKRAKKD